MPLSPATLDSQPSDSRFEVVRVLGAGGMARVYEVFDRVQGRRLALKRLHDDVDGQRGHRLELFEREFYTLSQLAHPSIVRVYDYGIDADGPYYTMELLEGGELQARAPLPHKTACLLARDLCSALSLLHSRRLVYRDLNPRNVHCSALGTPKLIDFGAIAAMGPCAQVVGTPAYCAPEAVDLQPLDARIDLFSLGATLYFALTARHAFPAKTFAQVRQLWDAPPPRPSVYVADVPAALENLVMDLLKFDPAARPANAGELMEQFSAIAGLTTDEQAGVMQAYLSTPSMVGREPQLAKVDRLRKRAARGQGSAVLVTSPSGAGRSRFLAACQLAGTLSGGLVVHSPASGASGDYAAMRALGHQLLDLAPELARRAAIDQLSILERIVPRLVSASYGPLAEGAAKLERAHVLAAFRGWFSEVARERPLLLVVDDYHRIDEPSAACIAWLAHACESHRMLLLASVESGVGALAPAALRLYESSSSPIALQNLDEAQTVELLRSVFGGVPHVQALGHKLFVIASGNPRDTMRLAQTLVDRGAVRYRSGAWSLPTSFDGEWLPQTMHEATARELQTLDPLARALVQVLSLADDRALTFEECALSCGDVPTGAVHAALDQLLRAQFVRSEAGRFTISHRGLHSALRTGIADDKLRAAHAHLATIFARRSDEPFRHAKHLLCSGDEMRGGDALVAFSIASQLRTDNDPDEYVALVLSMPEDWFEVFDAAIAACERPQRASTDVFRLRNRLASLLNVMGESSHVHLLALIRQLFQDSGLEAYAALDPMLDGGERLKRALSAVKQHYESTPEHARGLEPSVAIRYLVRSLMLGAGLVALGLDYELWRALPSIAPLAPLSPAFELIERLVGAVGSRVTGRHEQARAVYAQILERLAQPDLAGLDPSNHRFLRYGVMYGLALIEAGIGLASSVSWADTLEGESLHAVNALQVRMVHALWLGRVHEADRVRELAELRRIESSSRQMADGSHLTWQMLAHAYSDDLTRLQQVTDEVRSFAQRHAGWIPIVDYALAERHRMRGDHARALEYAQAALGRLVPGTHQIWPHAAAAHVKALCALGRLQAAVDSGESSRIAAERAELGYMTNYIRMPLAIACARLGERERARELAGEALQVFQDLGSAGLNLVLAHETCAQVAWHTGALDDYRTFAETCAELCRESGQGLRARSERLLRLAQSDQRAGLVAVELSSTAFGTTSLESTVRSAFTACDGPQARAERTLRLLLAQSGAQAGALCLRTTGGTALVASVGSEPTPELCTSMREYLDAELRQQGLVTASLDGEPGASQLSTVIGTYSLVLLCHQTSEGTAISGVAALSSSVGSRRAAPAALASRLSRLLSDAGDVVAAIDCE